MILENKRKRENKFNEQLKNFFKKRNGKKGFEKKIRLYKDKAFNNNLCNEKFKKTQF